MVKAPQILLWDNMFVNTRGKQGVWDIMEDGE